MRLSCLILALALAVPGTAPAQSPFAPVVLVNKAVVTNYEVDQRIKFLELLNAPGQDRKVVIDRLVDERLQLQAGKDMGVKLTAEQIQAGEEEFAQRASVSREDLIKGLAQGGVDETTFRDFVVSGLTWREVIRKRFGPAVQIGDADIDRVLSPERPRPDGIRVRFAEIILPARNPEEAAQSRARIAQIQDITSFDAFSAAARNYSASPSAPSGGLVDWVELQNIQPGLAQQLISMAPGQVSEPLPIPNGLAIFQLRAMDESGATPLARNDITVDYALLTLPGGRTPEAMARAEQIKARITSCQDLYPIARKNSGDQLVTDSKPMSEVPGDVALQLARMDVNEVDTTFGRGASVQLLMLCKRLVALPEGTTRDQIGGQLQGSILSDYAERYLAELRQNAIIRTP